MLKVHTLDGLTLSFDLFEEAQLEDLRLRLLNVEFRSGITGMTVQEKGVLYSLSRPEGFRVISLQAEPVSPVESKGIKGAEKIICFADDVRIEMIVHKRQRAVRINLSKIGKQRFNPALHSK